MANLQLPVSQICDTQLAIHTSTHDYDLSLVQKFQKHFSNISHKHAIVDYVKHNKSSS